MIMETTSVIPEGASGWCGRCQRITPWVGVDGCCVECVHAAGRCMQCREEAGTNMVDPVQPTDVRLVRDGEVIPLELVYIGPDDDGFHVWEVIRPQVVVERHDQLKVGMLPPDTTIRVPVGWD